MGESEMATPADVLQEVFGFAHFRPGQAGVIAHVLAGRSAAAVFPTGSGKSLCYQLPALMLGGATIVVSPLIALMKDQVDALQARGLPATFINSSISFAEQTARINALRRGDLKIVYIAPERFRSGRSVEALQSIRVALFARSEEHTSELQSHSELVCRLLLEKKKSPINSRIIAAQQHGC